MKTIIIFLKIVFKGGKMCGGIFVDMGKMTRSFYNIAMRMFGGR